MLGCLRRRFATRRCPLSGIRRPSARTLKRRNLPSELVRPVASVAVFETTLGETAFSCKSAQAEKISAWSRKRQQAKRNGGFQTRIDRAVQQARPFLYRQCAATCSRNHGIQKSASREGDFHRRKDRRLLLARSECQTHVQALGGTSDKLGRQWPHQVSA